MTQYNSLNLKVYINAQLNKNLIKNSNEIALKFSPDLIGDSNDETNFPYNLFDRQNFQSFAFSKFCNGFTNNLSANIKLAKTQLPKIVQSGGFLSRLLGLLLGLNLMKNILKQLAKIASA